MHNLENQWKSARHTLGEGLLRPEELIKMATHKKKSIIYFHFGNIIIFIITLVILSLFFNSICLKKSISKIGMFLMFSSLSVRVIVEIISTIRSMRIQLGNNASVSTDKALLFYSFRKKVHGPASISTVVIYIIGFYLLSPEFSKYIEIKWMIMMHLSFIIAALVLVKQAKKGMEKEIKILKSLIDLKKELNHN